MDVDSKGVARFDEGRVARAIFNLARNAIEAMQARGGTLSISAQLENRVLVIVVADTGPGIPEEIEGRLFQSFVTAGKKGGTGLGLAIVKKIVEEHGGEVVVSSSSQGVRFELRLPQPEPRETSDVTRAPAGADKSDKPGDNKRTSAKSEA
jgi:signal transduction histidine kinase